MLWLRKLLTRIYSYFFVRDDNFFPDFGILVNNAVPLTEIINNKLWVHNSKKEDLLRENANAKVLLDFGIPSDANRDLPFCK